METTTRTPAWIGACAFGGGGAGEAPAEGRSGETLTKATESPKIAPTRDPGYALRFRVHQRGLMRGAGVQ